MKLLKKLGALRGKASGQLPPEGELREPYAYMRYGAGLAGHPSQGLTPEGLSAIFMEADEGRTERQMRLYEEMEEKDAHLGAVLQSRKLAASGLGWEVVSAGDEDETVAEFVRRALHEADNLDEALASLMDAVAKGFACVEIVWELMGDRAYVRQFRPIRQGAFTFIEQGGAVSRQPRLLTPDSPVYGEELMQGKFMVHYAQGRAGHAPSAGAMRPCAWMYLFKNYTLKDWLVFSERFAQPMRVGKFTPGATQAERDVLRQAVFNLGSDAAAVISDSTVIELLESGGRHASAEVYEKLASYCDRSMSKAVLGQTLSTEQTGGGSYATARVHEAVRRDIIEADARALARTVRNFLVRPLVLYNFGPDAAVPGFRFVHEPAGDLKELAQAYAALGSMGFHMDEAQVLGRFGLRPARREAASE